MFYNLFRKNSKAKLPVYNKVELLAKVLNYNVYQRRNGKIVIFHDNEFDIREHVETTENSNAV